MMGIAFLSLFVSNNLVGWIGTLYEPLGPLKFWLLHAAIAACGGLLVLLFGRRLARVLNQGARQELRPAAMTLEVES